MFFLQSAIHFDDFAKAAGMPHKCLLDGTASGIRRQDYDRRRASFSNPGKRADGPYDVYRP